MSKEELYNLGAKLYEEEKFAEAIPVLSKAHARAQKDVDIIVLLAGCYIYIARFTKAARLLLEADKISSNDPMIKYNLSYARKLLNDNADIYDNVQLIFLSGVLYAKQREYLAAKEEFQSIRKYSKTALEYFEKTKQLIERRIKDFNFELKLAAEASVDMI